MSTTTKASLDKIKALNQMLEDLAGDEYEDFDVVDILNLTFLYH